jgi:hypothetical protein
MDIVADIYIGGRNPDKHYQISSIGYTLGNGERQHKNFID